MGVTYAAGERIKAVPFNVMQAFMEVAYEE